MEKMLKDHVSIITGGGSGMGEATAKLFSEEGATIVIADYNVENAKKVAAEITEAGGIARVYGQCDVSKEADCNLVAQKTIEEFGRVDDLVCYAGRTFDGDPNMTAAERLQKTFEVNYFGVYYCCFAVEEQMRKQQSGSIVICSSSGAFSPTIPAYEYHTSKGACEALTIQLAFALAPHGVRVNCMKPGLCISPFYDELPNGTAGFEPAINLEIPMKRAGYPIDFARISLFYCSELAGYVTGHCMYVGGGMGDIKSQAQSALIDTMEVGGR